jgi:hypothetical protein
VGFEAVIPNPKLKLLDQVREVMRLKHYTIRAERCYCDWIRRYIRFHSMRAREELTPGEAKIELFLSDLAVNGNVAVSTQNQAFGALLFLYDQVLHVELQGIHAVRADRPVRVPTVLTPEEPKAVILAMSETPQRERRRGWSRIENWKLRIWNLKLRKEGVSATRPAGSRTTTKPGIPNLTVEKKARGVGRAPDRLRGSVLADVKKADGSPGQKGGRPPGLCCNIKRNDFACFLKLV